MMTYEQAFADYRYWTMCAEMAERCGLSRWKTTGRGMGGVSYGEAIRGAMLTMQACEDREWMREIHVSWAIDQVLQDARRRRLLWQARQSRGVA